MFRNQYLWRWVWNCFFNHTHFSQDGWPQLPLASCHSEIIDLLRLNEWNLGRPQNTRSEQFHIRFTFQTFQYVYFLFHTIFVQYCKDRMWYLQSFFPWLWKEIWIDKLFSIRDAVIRIYNGSSYCISTPPSEPYASHSFIQHWGFTRWCEEGESEIIITCCCQVTETEAEQKTGPAPFDGITPQAPPSSTFFCVLPLLLHTLRSTVLNKTLPETGSSPGSKCHCLFFLRLQQPHVRNLKP